MTAGPLDGIRVLDLTVVLQPYGPMFLADYGAEVIRVESIQHFPPTTRGSYARPTKNMVAALGGGYPDGDPGERPWNRVPMYNSMARNKLCMTVDITQPEGMDIFKRLVRMSDVVMENNVPEVSDKLGINYEMLKKEKPDIIYAKVSGYGDNGTYRNYRAMASSIDLPTGHASLRGYTDMDPSELPNSAVGDPALGVRAAFAIMAALHYRKRTSKGQKLDLCLTEGFMPYMYQAFMDYAMNDRVQGTLGNRDPVAVPCGNFPCKGDDQWISITVYNDEDWEGFCRAVSEEWVYENRFKDALSRHKHEDELEALLGEWTKQYEAYELMHLLQKEGVAAGPLLNEAEAYADPHLIARGFFVEESQEDVGTYKYAGTVAKLGKSPLVVRRGPVRLGEDNEYVYKQILGISDAEYEKLVGSGHIGMDYAAHIK